MNKRQRVEIYLSQYHHLETAKIIYKLLTVIKLDNEDGLLGVYNPESGIYETSESFSTVLFTG